MLQSGALTRLSHGGGYPGGGVLCCPIIPGCAGEASGDDERRKPLKVAKVRAALVAGQIVDPGDVRWKLALVSVSRRRWAATAFSICKPIEWKVVCPTAIVVAIVVAREYSDCPIGYLDTEELLRERVRLPTRGGCESRYPLAAAASPASHAGRGCARPPGESSYRRVAAVRQSSHRLAGSSAAKLLPETPGGSLAGSLQLPPEPPIAPEFIVAQKPQPCRPWPFLAASRNSGSLRKKCALVGAILALSQNPMPL